MAEATTNQTKNVSVAKGVAGGYYYAAPIGTALPTDYSTELNEAFKLLGYISEDGITESTDEDTTELLDMNGDTVASEQASHTKTFANTMMETKAGVLKEYFGDSCVTDEDGMITVAEKSGMRVNHVYVYDLALQNGRRERIVVPNGKVTEVGEITYASGEALGYETTTTAFPDDDGVKTYRYIESTETERSTLSMQSLNAPTMANTVAEIDRYASDNGIDLMGASTKAQKLAVINGEAVER